MVDREVLQQVLDKLGYVNYAEIVNEFQHKVYSTAYTFTQNTQDAEDLSQEIFWLVYQNLETFKMDSQLSTWIYKIAVNKCMMHRRKEARRKNIAKILPMTHEISENLASKNDVDMDVIKSEDKDILYQAIECISIKYATVITLRYMQELSVKEIGQILNLPQRTVETQLYRAKTKLKLSLNTLGYNTEGK